MNPEQMNKWQRIAFCMRLDFAPRRIVDRYRRAVRGNANRWYEALLELLSVIILLIVAFWRTIWIPILPLLDALLSVQYALTATPQQWATLSRHVRQTQEARKGGGS